MKICSTSSSSLPLPHPLKSWGLRQTRGGSLQDAVNTLKQAFESVGNAIVEAIGPKTTELFKSLAKWIQDNIGFVKDLALAFGAAAAAMIGLKIAFVAASFAMTMTPLGKILLLVSLLAGAVVTLRENWEKVGPYVTGVMDDWKSRFWGMVDAIKNGGPLLLEAFKQGFSDAFDWLAQKLEWLWNKVPGHELLSGLWDKTKTGLSWLNKEFGVGSAQGSTGGSATSMSGETGGDSASRSFRNNNPGNIKYGEFAKSHGATGQDSGGFAQFPDEETGKKAQRDLWETDKIF